jgi:hypothetical protein
MKMISEFYVSDIIWHYLLTISRSLRYHFDDKALEPIPPELLRTWGISSQFNLTVKLSIKCRDMS